MLPDPPERTTPTAPHSGNSGITSRSTAVYPSVAGGREPSLQPSPSGRGSFCPLSRWERLGEGDLQILQLWSAAGRQLDQAGAGRDNAPSDAGVPREARGNH